MSTLKLIARRLLFLIFVIWAASTITFFVPRFSSRSPIRERFAELARNGGFSPVDLEKIIAAMQHQFGLDKPLMEQYVDYLWSVGHLDFGYSLNKYPSTVIDLISQSLPWTMGLLLITTVISFLHRQPVGRHCRLAAAPSWLRTVATPFVLLTGVPPVLMGVLLLFFIAFRMKLLPLGGCLLDGHGSQLVVGLCPGHGCPSDPAGARFDPGLGRWLGALDARAWVSPSRARTT